MAQIPRPTGGTCDAGMRVELLESASSASLSADDGEEDQGRSPCCGSAHELDLSALSRSPLEPQALQHLSYAVNSLGYRLLRHLPRQQNLSFSPSQLYWLLASLCLVSRGGTKDQLEALLRLCELPLAADHVRGFFKSLIRSMRKGGRCERLQLISALFVSSVDALHEASSKAIRENFFVSIRTVLEDARPERARNEINRWFESASRGFIPSVMSENLPADSSLQLMASAAYAEHVWGSRLDHHKTVLANFYNNGTEPCKTRMVRSVSYYRYCTSKALAARCLVIPGRSWCMLLVLPMDRRGVHVVEHRLDADALRQTLGDCRSTHVELSMPNIELESSVSLREAIRHAGVEDLFQEGKADLSGLFKAPGTPLTEFVHKAKLRVNRTGQEGEHSDVTVVTESGVVPLSPVEFHVNHPFVFVLYDPSSNVTQFFGRVVELLW